MTEHEFENEHSEFSLRDIYFVVFRHKRTVLMLFLAVMVIAALLYVVLGANGNYTSEAKLLVRIGRESVAVDRTAAPGEPVRAGRSRTEEIRTEIEIIKSPKIARKVVDAVGIEKFFTDDSKLPGMEKSFSTKLVDKIKEILDVPVEVHDPLKQQMNLRTSVAKGLLESLECKPVSNSSVFSVAYTAWSPELAHDALKKLIELYLERRLSIHFTDSTYKFLREQTEMLRIKLEQTEADIRDYKNKTGTDLMDEQSSLQQAAAIKQGVSETESELIATRAKVRLLKDRITKLFKIGVNQETGDLSGPAPEEVRRRLYALKMQEQELLSTYTEQSIPVLEVRRQIKEIMKLLRREEQPQQVAQPMVSIEVSDQLQLDVMVEEANIVSLEAKTGVLREQFAVIQDETKKLYDKAVILAQLERKKEINESSYLKHAGSLEQSRIDQAMKMEQISNISIAQPATYPLEPDKSKKNLILPLGLLGGIIAGIALAFLIESLDHTLKRPEDIKRKLNLSALVSIPRFNGDVLLPDISKVENLKRIPELHGASGNKAVSAPDINEEAQKCFEILLHRILFSDKKSEDLPYVIAVTSCRRGEGVSTVSANLAFNLARLTHHSKARVLLVDMNLIGYKGPLAIMPYPNIGNMLAIRNVKDGDSLPSRLDHVFTYQSSEEGESTKIIDLSNLWKNEYDFVVMDMPPVLDESSVGLLTRLSDKVLLVVEAEHERWEVVNHVKELLENTQANLIGVILNKRNFYIPRWLYKML